MSSENINYYILAGESLEMIQPWIKARMAGLEQRNRFMEKYRAKEVLTSLVSVSGLIFKDPARVPKGFRPRPKWYTNAYAPDARTKEGREIKKEMEAIRVPSGLALGDIFNATVWGLRLLTPSLEKLDGKYVIGVPEGCKPTLPDAIPLKQSEYWTMKERGSVAA